MTRTVLIAAIAFVGGVGVGLFAAKLYARKQVAGGVHDLLAPIGLGDGRVEAFLQGIIVPGLVG